MATFGLSIYQMIDGRKYRMGIDADFLIITPRFWIFILELMINY